MAVDRNEKYYIIGTIVLLTIFAIAVAISAFAIGIQLPAPQAQVDPRTVATPGVSPFGAPVDERVRELAPGKYEAYILAQMWAFVPGEIRVPAGSEITFYLTSKDVQHGFKVDKTNINMMVIPGQVSKLTATFDEPGTYDFICHEYCGTNHHFMAGKVVVE
jgi:cytochrome c oxidase subunit 2